jgi:Flp pilus assembly protein TadB
MFVWMQISNPEYSGLLLDRTGGQLALVAAGAQMILGGFWLKKIISIKF